MNHQHTKVTVHSWSRQSLPKWKGTTPALEPEKEEVQYNTILEARDKVIEIRERMAAQDRQYLIFIDGKLAFNSYNINHSR